MSAIEYKNNGFQLSLDPLEFEERTSSIAFSISLSLKAKPHYSLLTQSIEYKYPHVWVETDELNRFEKELKEKPKAQLRNMSGCVLFSVYEIKGITQLEINPEGEHSSSKEERIHAKVLLGAGVKQALSLSFSEYPKWW
ncbi:hypothetical protein [Undibacterium macrobrachii]|uniref:Uncharacterized protein n=1 Tax=Undibacterium macrobrachii TaxID=1119058 RepID=A0ABQ2XGW6_9BURK|nr:hypothetical protein [Undibacterium macrobrachii]GGX15927.1 hypothetical protein GCM10011282_22860 [Undibacterium macrobrachii]